MNDHLHQPFKVKDGLELHFVNDIAIIVMNNGENRMNPAFVDDFNVLLDEVERNSSCKGLITTGRGKFYCNGIDLDWMKQNPQKLAEFLSQTNKFIIRLLLFPVPTLAAINGHAFAGGAVMAIAHDLRVQSQNQGWLCLNEVFINLRFERGLVSLMRTKVGGGHLFTDAAVLGKRYTGPEALKSGLVHAAPPMSLMLAESIQLLKSFYGKSGYPRKSLQLMKSDVFRDALDLFKTFSNEMANSFTAKL
ncbi:hypothetical protein RRG08_044673 [Elysia crispata]|uniref:Uncharacterized protein n=1 Tax=Elysia crispata TaxID=231223 RepID=A0AAE0ZZX3_9GAST|nr:hypothetical protein RRG08_044673 [Elysia crispata]